MPDGPVFCPMLCGLRRATSKTRQGPVCASSAEMCCRDIELLALTRWLLCASRKAFLGNCLGHHVWSLSLGTLRGLGGVSDLVWHGFRFRGSTTGPSQTGGSWAENGTDLLTLGLRL